MDPTAIIPLEDGRAMSETERLEALFMRLTEAAVHNLEKELVVSAAAGDADAEKLHHVQISMYRHTQSIFRFARQLAADRRWNHEDQASTA